MIENRDQQTHEFETKDGFWTGVLFIVKGFLFSCGSGAFYREASKKRLISAIFFFFIFALAITSVATIQLGVGMTGVGSEIQGAYERGEFPTIVIENGVAQIDGDQPFIFESKRQVVAIDTTGKIKEIDTQSYSEGLLLTRTEIHFVNEDGYQIFPLSDLHESFGNPIVVDKTQALELWNTASVWIILLAFVGIFIWNSLIRFVYILFLGLIIWGIVSIKKTGVGFSLILITGIYANVPVIYLKSLLKLVNISFFSLYTILLFIGWGIVLWTILKRPKETHLPVKNEF